MATIAFDTHAVVKKLRESGFAEAQAEALTEAITGAQQVHLQQLATKQDLAELRAELIKWMFGVAAGQIALIVTLLKLIP